MHTFWENQYKRMQGQHERNCTGVKPKRTKNIKKRNFVLENMRQNSRKREVNEVENKNRN